MTIAEICRQAEVALSAAGIERPRRDVEELCAAVLGCEPLDIYIAEPPTAAQRAQIAAWVAGRAQHQPVQYLTQRARFCGREYVVSPATLIPRPETELAVSEALTWIARTFPQDTNLVGIDIGTGCGSLAISLTTVAPFATMVAIDRALPALHIAQVNARKHDVATQVRLLQCDGLRGLAGDCVPHLIIANPPYIPSNELRDVPSEVQQEPRLALDGGAQGLRCYTEWIPQAAAYVRPHGLVVLELGMGQAAAVAAIVAQTTLRVQHITHDWNNIPRVLVAQRV
jgi:release factor glutamine methyltransferase